MYLIATQAELDIATHFRIVYEIGRHEMTNQNYGKQSATPMVTCNNRRVRSALPTFSKRDTNVLKLAALINLFDHEDVSPRFYCSTLVHYTRINPRGMTMYVLQ